MAASTVLAAIFIWEVRMTNQEILEQLYCGNMDDPKVISAIFDMGQAMNDRDVMRQARDLAYKLAYKTISGGFPLVKRILFTIAPWDFDAFLQALEWERRPEDRFYIPRRKGLAPIVNGIQALSDDKLDELFISMPPRVGKSTLMMMYMTWMMGRNPELSNLYCSYSDTLTGAFYNGVLEVINDPDTYQWHEIFQHAQIVRTNNQEEWVDINRKKRYHSLTCRSLYGTLNGACDATGLLISDDLLSGIEEALNKDRLETVWGKVDNNMLTRAKLDQGCKLLWCGTRWSLQDPIGKRIDTLTGSEKFRTRRFKVINVPALNENDESNFDYQYGVGFSTETYHQRRASFERNDDMASWLSQYQGEPIEREGTLFSAGSLRYYNGVLPDEPPVRVFMAVDPAFGGADRSAGPVCFKYDNGDIYVPDVLFTDGDKTVSQPFIVALIKRYNIAAVQVEASKTIEAYVDELESRLKQEGIRINLTSKPASSQLSKTDRIFDKAPDIRERMIFLDQGKRSKEYSLFMQNVFSFKVMSKSKQHDDAPDSLAQAIEMDSLVSAKAKVYSRLW